jgi:hypothetical protein
MASPAHTAVLQPELGRLHGASMHEKLGAPRLASAEELQLHGDHCAMEWSWPRNDEETPAFSPVLLWSHPALKDGLAATRPSPRALGPPPERADRQALLQVFRM